MVESVLISGVDGSGKSTITKMLVRYLSMLGLKTCYTWFRWRAFLLYTLYVYSRVRGLYRSIRRLNGSHIRAHFLEADSVLPRLYPYVLTLDLITSYLVQLLLFKLRRCDVVIYDRGPVDVLIDLLYLKLRSGGKLSRALMKFYTLFTLRIARSAVVLIASEHVILQRKRDIVSLTEVQFKLNLYRILSRSLNLPIIDTTTKSVDQTFEETIAILSPSNRFRDRTSTYSRMYTHHR